MSRLDFHPSREKLLHDLNPVAEIIYRHEDGHHRFPPNVFATQPARHLCVTARRPDGLLFPLSSFSLS